MNSKRFLCAKSKLFYVWSEIIGQKNSITQYSKQIAQLTIANIGERGIFVFFIMPGMAKLLGARSFGSLMLVFSVTSFILPVATGGLTQTIYRLHKNIPDLEKNNYWGTIFFVILIGYPIISFSLVPLSALLTNLWQAPLVGKWLPLLTPYLYFYLVFSITRLICYVNLQFKELMYVNLVNAMVVALAVPLQWYFSGNAWVIAFNCGPLVGLICLISKLLISEQISFRKLKFSLLVDMIKPTLVFSLGIIPLWLFRIGDKWILGFDNLSTEVVAFYAVAIQASLIVAYPIERFNGLLVAKFSNIVSLQSITIQQINKFLKITFIALVWVLFVGPIFGFVYIRIFFSQEYWTNGHLIFFILMIGIVFYTISQLSQGFILKFASIYIITGIQIFQGLSTFLLMFIISRYFGILGLAGSKTFGYIIPSLIYLKLCYIPLLKLKKIDSQQSV
jgi:O-antigen/teichoic acid export membrane protein